MPRLTTKARKWLFALAIACIGHAASAADVDTLVRQYANDMFDAVGSIAVRQDFPATPRVKLIAARLCAALGEQPWTLLIFREADMPKDMDMPAFALPGKRIALSDWKADKASDDALAFMIGHEIGHVKLEHQKRLFTAIIKRTAIRPDNWCQVAAHAGGSEPLEREQEYEADRFGFDLATLAEYDAVAGAREALGHLRDDDQHPPAAQRLARLGIRP
jgi:Zn-dependent protease with chaperone function